MDSDAYPSVYSMKNKKLDYIKNQSARGETSDKIHVRF